MRSIFITTWLLGAGLAEAAPCPPTATLRGEATLVDAVAQALRTRTIAVTPTAGCPHAEASIERAGRNIEVIVRDASGRSVTRQLQTLDATAALIASWAQADVNASLLEGWSYEGAPSPPRVDRPQRAATVAVAPSRWRADAGFELSFDQAATIWSGGRLGACAAIGRACIGVDARFATADGARALDGLLVARVSPVRAERYDLELSAGVGLGNFAVTLDQDGMPRSSETSARVSAAARAAWRLTPSLALQLGAGAGFSPQAPITLTVGEAVRTNGEPQTFARFEAGLRWGGP